jgi:hypothetical protein
MAEFSYSYNGSNYRGVFTTREEALQAALKGIGGLDVLPLAIFVARRVPADPHATDLARHVLSVIRARAADDLEDAGSDYLARVTPQQVATLDSALQTAVVNWLSTNDFLNRQFHVDSVSEHPIPNVPQTHSAPVVEVSMLGIEE